MRRPRPCNAPPTLLSRAAATTRRSFGCEYGGGVRVLLVFVVVVDSLTPLSLLCRSAVLFFGFSSPLLHFFIFAFFVFSGSSSHGFSPVLPNQPSTATVTDTARVVGEPPTPQPQRRGGSAARRDLGDDNHADAAPAVVIERDPTARRPLAVLRLRYEQEGTLRLRQVPLPWDASTQPVANNALPAAASRPSTIQHTGVERKPKIEPPPRAAAFRGRDRVLDLTGGDDSDEHSTSEADVGAQPAAAARPADTLRADAAAAAAAARDVKPVIVGSAGAKRASDTSAVDTQQHSKRPARFVDLTGGGDDDDDDDDDDDG
jgi:hypothetical protein